MRLLATLILGLALAVSAACVSEQSAPANATATSESLVQTTGPTPGATATASAAASLGFLLNITSPDNESIVNTPSVTVRGKSTADAVVSVNGQLAEVGTDGSFESFVALEVGPNTIEIVANDFHGGQSSKMLTVIYVP